MPTLDTQLQVRIDRKLDRALTRTAKSFGMDRATLVRFLLRGVLIGWDVMPFNATRKLQRVLERVRSKDGA